MPAITAAYLGFVNGDTAASLTTPPTCSTTATSTSPVGSYPTSCSGAVDPNYTISYIDGSLQVGPAPLAITASSASITYGGAAPVITASYSGFVNGDNATSLTTAPTCTTSVTSVSPVGTYGSTCSGAVDPNYTFSYVDGSVQVGPASITVTASSGSMTYGGAVPAITASVAGLQNGEDASVLGAGLTCSTDGHLGQSGGQLPDLVLGGGRRQLHHHLRERVDRRGAGGLVHHGFVGVDDLRGIVPDHHGVVLGLRERGHSVVAHHAARRAPRRPRRRARWAPTTARARGPRTPTTRSATWTARCRS